MMAYKRNVSYTFSTGHMTWEITHWDAQHIEFSNVYGGVEKVDGRWIWWDGAGGADGIRKCWGGDVADAVLAHFNEHGAPEPATDEILQAARDWALALTIRGVRNCQLRYTGLPSFEPGESIADAEADEQRAQARLKNLLGASDG